MNSGPQSRDRGMVVQDMGDELLIYDLDHHKAFCLNRTCALVWQNCDGQRTVGELGRIVGRELSAPVTDDLVWLAIDELNKHDLLVDKLQIPPRLDGVSRRQVLRSIGLASVVALPIVSSLAAPPALSAQSAACPGGTIRCTPGGPCVNTLTDPLHCGGCNQPCGPGHACVAGLCV